MKYENQIVILGFILGLVVVAINIICLGINERRKDRKLNVWKMEIQWFLFNSFLGLFGIFFGMVSLVYATGAALQGYWAEKGASAFSVVIMVLVVWGCYFLYLSIFHPSVLMGKYTNRRDLLQSIKSEKFTKLIHNCYVSEHWIVIGEYFVPKTCLIGMDSYFGRGYRSDYYHFKIYTIDGKETYVRMAAIIHSYKDANDIIDHVGQYATVSHFLTHFESPRAGLLSADHELEGCFWDYIEHHKDFDLLNDTSCADQIIEHWKNRKF